MNGIAYFDAPICLRLWSLRLHEVKLRIVFDMCLSILATLCLHAPIRICVSDCLRFWSLRLHEVEHIKCSFQILAIESRSFAIMTSTSIE